MKDIIELISIIQEKHGEDIWINSYEPPVGYYFKINKDNTIDFSEYKTKSQKEEFQQNKDYDFYKTRMFYEGMLMFIANKAIDTSNKKIHSVTSNAIIFKYEHLNSLYKYLDKHFKVITENYRNDLETDNLVIEFLEYVNNVKELLPSKIKDTDRIIILKDEPFENYKDDYYKYLLDKVFVDNKTKLTVDNVDYGLFTVGVTINPKKPLLSINPYSSKMKKCSYRISKEDCILLSNAFKLDYSELEKLLQTENPFVKFIYSGTGEIIDYDMNFKLNNDRKKICNHISILESEYNSPTTKTSYIDREELLKLLDISSNFLFSKLLTINNGDYKKILKDSPNMKIYSNLLSNKNILNYYFKENGDIDISDILEKILYGFMEDNVLTNKDIHSDDKPLCFYKERNNMDLLFTIINYLREDGEYFNMSENIKVIWDKLLESKSKNYLEINSDEEFLFLSGQILTYLSGKSKASSRNGLLIQDVFNVKDFDEIKSKLIDKYSKYLYLLSLHEKSYVNLVYTALLGYEMDTNTKLNSNKTYKYYYQSGLIGKNIFYTKIENEIIEEEK